MMRFEYDADKSEANRIKHGIGFDNAQRLWDDPDLVEIPARSTDEPRYLIVARLNGKYWSAIITYRGRTIRIISVRRSRTNEIEIYESD